MLLHLDLPTTKTEAQHFVGLFGFWRWHIIHLGVLLVKLLPLYQKEPFLFLLTEEVSGYQSVVPISIPKFVVVASRVPRDHKYLLFFSRFMLASILALHTPPLS